MNLTISLSAFGRSLTLCLDSDTDSDDTTDRPLSLSRVPVGPYGGLALCDCSAAVRSNSGDETYNLIVLLAGTADIIES